MRAGGWEASSALHHRSQNFSQQQRQKNTRRWIESERHNGTRAPGRNPCLEESCASKLLAKCRGLVQKCSRHLFLFQRPALNAAASALPPSGCLTGLFAGLLGRSQHTKCVSSIPTLLLKRAINPMLCKRCLHFIYTVVFFSLLSLTAGQMPFVPLLRRDAVRFCFLRDNF